MDGWKPSDSAKHRSGYAPRCYAVAYERTKQAIRDGSYLSKHQMFQDLLAEDLFVWRHDGFIKSAITRAIEEKL